MFVLFEYLMSWLIVVCGKLYAHICQPPKGLPPDEGVENEDQLSKE